MRAGLVEDAADYRYSSYGEWAQKGHHPFADTVERYLAPSLALRQEITTINEAMELLKIRFSNEFSGKTEAMATPEPNKLPAFLAVTENETVKKHRKKLW